MYRAIKFFTDLQDGGYPYNVGDIFPRKGAAVTEARLQELSTTSNRQGVPLIQAVVEKTAKAAKGTKKKPQ